MKSGYISIVGRPNVGKSTLLNRILGQKISITSRKPQTTRHNILGIKTSEDAQMIYVDTPGMHLNVKNAMNQYMNRSANQTLHDVDVILFLIEGTKWIQEDEAVLRKFKDSTIPVILVINKTDVVTDKSALLPHLKALSNKMAFAEVIAVSAKTGKEVGALETIVKTYLQESEQFFPEDQITDRSSRFLASEIIREKLMRKLGQELPYAITVEIEQFKEEGGLYDISAAIWVERKGQKAIIIGKKGENLKLIGRQARVDMEKLFEHKVFLQLWVKVKEGWSDNIRALRSLGYTDE
ncbi:MAG TPA: GTPase Era [Gammaproteobacteria bacterium]|nr:GTPase Era [Gammaproteobacteria bacterium]